MTPPYGGVLSRSSSSVSRGAGPGWLSPNISIHGQLGSMGTTAQVQPAAFTAGMMRAAEARGAGQWRLGRVTGLSRRGKRGGRRSRRRHARGRRGRDRDGALGRASLAAQWLPSGLGYSDQAAQPCLRDRSCNPIVRLCSSNMRKPRIRSCRRRFFLVSMAPRMCVRFRASLPSRLIPITSFPTMVRSIG